MAEGQIGNSTMAASYSVTIDGIKRTRAEIAKLDGAIAALRKANYTPGMSVTAASQLGGRDLLVTKIDALEGRVQTAVLHAMSSGMALGRRVQTAALNAAVTETGASRPGGSAGRNETGAMIAGIGTNVETFKTAMTTVITGWHGWGTGQRAFYWFIQEKGNKGPHRTNLNTPAAQRKDRTRKPILAANSLGHAIPVVRENLKKNLGALR